MRDVDAIDFEHGKLRSRTRAKCDRVPTAVKRSVEVDIAGQKLMIRSDEGPDYVQELADYVDAHLRELSSGKRTTYNLQRMALLVAMQIADELFREKDLHQRLRQRVEAKLQALKSAVDEHESRLQAL